MRCNACDAIMKPEEVIWIPDRHSHEPLCRWCRRQVQESILGSELDSSPVSYTSDDSEDINIEDTLEEAYKDVYD